MGRIIYLMRHGKPNIQGKRCIGLTDVPLSEAGRIQVGKVCRWLKKQNIGKIYSSPLTRCRETAKIVVEEVCSPPKAMHIVENLREMSVGQWENMTFGEIKEKYPEEYAKRGENIGYFAPPEGESFDEAGKRFGDYLNSIIYETEGDILVVAHAGVIRGYLCHLMGISLNQVMTLPQPYAGLTILEQTDDLLAIRRHGWKPIDCLDTEEIECIYKECNTPWRVINHMKAVADFIEKIKEELPEHQREQYDWERLNKAALLHDIKRSESNHAEASADFLLKKGYKEVADLVRFHHDSSIHDGLLTETELLFYADKRVVEDTEVTIEERFAESSKKCHTPEAKEKHKKLYEKSKMIEFKILKYTGGKEEHYLE